MNVNNDSIQLPSLTYGVYLHGYTLWCYIYIVYIYTDVHCSALSPARGVEQKQKQVRRTWHVLSVLGIIPGFSVPSLFTDYGTVTIKVDGDNVGIYFSNGERWNELWPTCDPPRGHYLFPVDSAIQWWGVDFASHVWCRPMADFLSAQITMLKFALPSLTTLLEPGWKIEQCQNLRTIFRTLMVFARLSMCYAQSSSTPSASVLGDRGFILDALKTGLDRTSHVVARQVSAISKGSKNPHNEKGKKRNFQPFSRKNKGFKQKGSRPPLKCYKCGKLGHIKRNCKEGVTK